MACSIKGWFEKEARFGGTFSTKLEFLKETEWYSEERINQYQITKLKEIIDYSYQNVEYYKELFDSIKLNPNDIKSLEDLQYIPVLDKESVRNNFEKLKNPNYKGDIKLCHTSGSTGKSLQFYLTKSAIQFRWAVWYRHRARFGVSINDKYATFTGLPAIPLNQKQGPFYRENWPMKQTIFTMHHLGDEKIPSIVKRLNRGDLVYYSGYPSILYALALAIEKLGLKISHFPKVIFTGAETLYDFQKSKIMEVFGSLVTDQYGFSEGAGNASKCEFDLYHEDFEYGVLERGSANGLQSDFSGEIIATGFSNLAMPLIRYKVGDIGTWTTEVCPCGRKSKTLKLINGRNEDFVITPEGNKILRFDYIFKNTKNIVESQIVQNKLGEIVFRIIKREGYNKKEEIHLIQEIKAKISPSINVIFEYPDFIERTNTGKFKAVISNIKKNS